MSRTGTLLTLGLFLAVVFILVLNDINQILITAH